MNGDGTLLLTLRNGSAYPGTWVMNGNVVTVHGIGPGGTEDWTYANGQLTSFGGQVCTRT